MKKRIIVNKKQNYIITAVILVVALIITIISGIQFSKFRSYQTKFVVRENIITRVEKFSKYSPKLKGTIGDSNIYVIEGTDERKIDEPWPSILVIGGTHPNEPSGQLAATLFLENVVVKRGTVFIITEANRSAYSHSQPLEGTSMYYYITTEYGIRTFKFGTRATNFVDQWPNPDVYSHDPSGQKLSSNDVRNLNRSYPGSPNGTYTEKIAWAITNCIIQNKITMTVDLHEASPEYLTINAIIGYPGKTDSANFNNDSYSLAGDVAFNMGNTVDISAEVSPVNLHGISHRELGTYTDTFIFLCETANASQGKLRGAFTDDIIITGKDKFYDRAEKLGLLYAPPVHINERVGRHILAVKTIIESFNAIWANRADYTGYGINTSLTNMEEPVKLGTLEISNIPTYEAIMEFGVGKYLL